MKSQSAGHIPTPEERQAIFLQSVKLLPVLARRGAAPRDAVAIAFNAAFLFRNMRHSRLMFSPKTILRKYSYAEIASLCEHLLGTAEFAVNKNYKED